MHNGENNLSRLSSLNKYYQYYARAHTASDPFTADIKSGVDISNSPVTMMLENDVLLTSIYSLCGAVMFIMFITCLILSLVFLKLLRKKDQESSLSQARAQCLEDGITTEADMDNLKVDLTRLISIVQSMRTSNVELVHKGHIHMLMEEDKLTCLHQFKPFLFFAR